MSFEEKLVTSRTPQEGSENILKQAENLEQNQEDTEAEDAERIIAKEELVKAAQQQEQADAEKYDEILKKFKGEGAETPEENAESKELSEKEKAFNKLIKQEEEFKDTVDLDRGNRISLKEIDNVEISSEVKEKIVEGVKSGEFFNQKYSGDKMQTLCEKGIISVEDIIGGINKRHNTKDILKFPPDLLTKMAKNENLANYGADTFKAISEKLESVEEIGHREAPAILEDLAVLAKYMTLAKESRKSVDLSEYKRIAPKVLDYFKENNDADRIDNVKIINSDANLLKSISDSGMLKKDRVKNLFLDKIPSTKKTGFNDENISRMVVQGMLTKEEALSMME